MEKTLKNLAAAFIGESQARNRYTMFAKVAIKEGYEQIGANFFETAEQEAEHAKWLYRLIQDLKSTSPIVLENVEIEAPFGNTIENLKASIGGEMHENQSMYPDFARIAEEENLPEIAKRLRSIAIAELHHADRFKSFLEDLEAGTLFAKSEPTAWVCRKCGYMQTSPNAPTECPSCGHPTAYFQHRCGRKI